MRPWQMLLLPPVAWLGCVGLMLMLHGMVPVASLLPWPAKGLGLLPLVAGLALASWHARLFRRIRTNINTFGEPGQLTTAGLYAKTRNPMYLGMALGLVGAAVLLGSLSVWVGPMVFLALANLWYIPLEERAMAGKFGAAYAAYRQSVPRWL